MSTPPQPPTPPQPSTPSQPPAPPDLEQLLATKRVCVCVGPGGVGKTTVSAALALGLAARGRKVAVVTIDPARRLADALGLAELDNEPQRIAEQRLAEVTLDGELWAMTLDPKQTFDELIDDVARDGEQAEAIKHNHIYREISGAVAGSQEYTAVAKLYELARSERFDLLVLDTPPARNALDFLDAPRRLTAFLEGRTLQALLAPTGFGARLLAPLLGGLRRLTGVDVIGELTTFFGLLGPMSAEFGARAHAVQTLLRSDQSTFLIVTRANAEPIDDALALHAALHQRKLPFAAAIVNRLQRPATEPADDVSALCEPQLGPALAARVAASVADRNALATHDDHQLQRLREVLGAEPLVSIEQLDDDIHDTVGLAQISRRLFR